MVPLLVTGYCHFCCILLVKASHMTSPDPQGGEVDSTQSILSPSSLLLMGFSFQAKVHYLCGRHGWWHQHLIWFHKAVSANMWPWSVTQVLWALVFHLYYRKKCTHHLLSRLSQNSNNSGGEKGLLSYYLSLKQKEAQLLTSGTCLSLRGAPSPAIYQGQSLTSSW